MTSTLVDRRRNRQLLAQRAHNLKLARMRDDDTLEEAMRKEIAATLIARRIVLGIDDAALVEKLGTYCFSDKLKYKRKATRERLIYEEARRIERDLLADGRLSSFQRYARLVGMKVDIGIGSERAARLSRRMPVWRMARHIRTRRRYLADKYKSRRNNRPRRRLAA